MEGCCLWAIGTQGKNGTYCHYTGHIAVILAWCLPFEKGSFHREFHKMWIRKCLANFVERVEIILFGLAHEIKSDINNFA